MTPSKKKTKAASANPGPAAHTIMWFRNDLRLHDNAALAAALDAAETSGGHVVPVFILDEDAAGKWKPGGASGWWLHHSLGSLASSLERKGSRLILRRGAAASVLAEFAEQCGVTSVYCSRRYEPWAVRQEETCRVGLAQQGVELKRYGGGLLVEPEKLATKSGEPFKVYTPFWRALAKDYVPSRPSPLPQRLAAPTSWPASERIEDWRLIPTRPDWARGFAEHWTPGEDGARHQLEGFLAGPVTTYAEDRNRPDLTGTSRLSPHLAHGEISPRLIWWQVEAARSEGSTAHTGLETFLKELVWREFSYHLLLHFPDLPEAPFRKDFGQFQWRKNPAGLRAWQRGLTGYPIVDAGMRELWATGWMHNRVRMIVASFLVKDLLLPWQEGERWFWDTLVDADLANNAASWQWVAGSGADAAPYFRIFNPVTQGEKFDPAGDYVRRWVPEIARLPDRFVHRPFDADAATLAAADLRLGDTYPAPIVVHAEARAAALAAFEGLRKSRSSQSR